MIAVGVDTHKHEHLARALDHLGQALGGLTVDASLAGYTQLTQWLRTLGEDVLVGIEGAGSYGAGLCEYLLAEGISVGVRSSAPAAKTADEGSPTRSTRSSPRRRCSPTTGSPRPEPAAHAKHSQRF